MLAFNPETGEVIAPAGTASLAFFHADRPDWTANAYRTAECEGTRQGSHGSVIAALPDGSFPPVFLWDELNYRVKAKAADGALLATIDRVTPESEWVAVGAPVAVEAPAELQASVDVLSEIDALREIVAAQTAELDRLRAADVHSFPLNMSDKLVDWVEPASEDLQQLMAGEETLAAAVERMTPGLDELLDMASALSEASFEQAIVTIPVEKRNTWTERLFDERARLRLKRNTDEENLDRENLISRVATVFTKVGSKR